MGTERRWHPILDSFEPTPGEWWLRDSHGVTYAIVKLLRRGDELGYRVVTYAERSDERQLVGYYKRLTSAAEHAHARHIRETGHDRKKTA